MPDEMVPYDVSMDIPKEQQPPPPEGSAPPWEDVADQFQKTFPLMPSEELKKQYEGARKMGMARDQARYELGKTEDVAKYISRRSVPVVSHVIKAEETIGYNNARKRVEAGDAGDDDYKTVARYEHTQKQEEEFGKTWTGTAVGALAHIPAIVGEFGLAGKAIGGAARATLPGAALPWVSRAAAKEAGIAVPVLMSKAGLGQAATGLLPLTAAVPSMYVEKWTRDNMAEGRDPLDVRGLPKAFGMGLLQTMVFGAIGKVATQIPGEGTAAWFQRWSAGLGTGVGAAQVVDVAAPLLGLETRYGAWSDMADGKWGDAGRHLFGQVVTFSAFSALHAHVPGEGNQYLVPSELGRKTTAYLDAMAQKGVARDVAVASLQPAFGAMADLMKTNPDPSRAEARKAMESLPEGELRDFGYGLAEGLPERTGPPVAVPPAQSPQPRTPSPGSYTSGHVDVKSKADGDRFASEHPDWQRVSDTHFIPIPPTSPVSPSVGGAVPKSGVQDMVPTMPATEAPLVAKPGVQPLVPTAPAEVDPLSTLSHEQVKDLAKSIGVRANASRVEMEKSLKKALAPDHLKDVVDQIKGQKPPEAPPETPMPYRDQPPEPPQKPPEAPPEPPVPPPTQPPPPAPPGAPGATGGPSEAAERAALEGREPTTGLPPREAMTPEMSAEARRLMGLSPEKGTNVPPAAGGKTLPRDFGDFLVKNSVENARAAVKGFDKTDPEDPIRDEVIGKRRTITLVDTAMRWGFKPTEETTRRQIVDYLREALKRHETPSEPDTPEARRERRKEAMRQKSLGMKATPQPVRPAAEPEVPPLPGGPLAGDVERMQAHGLTPLEQAVYTAWKVNGGDFREVASDPEVVKLFGRQPSHQSVVNWANAAHEKMGGDGSLAASAKGSSALGHEVKGKLARSEEAVNSLDALLKKLEKEKADNGGQLDPEREKWFWGQAEKLHRLAQGLSPVPRSKAAKDTGEPPVSRGAVEPPSVHGETGGTVPEVALPPGAAAAQQGPEPPAAPRPGSEVAAGGAEAPGHELAYSQMAAAIRRGVEAVGKGGRVELPALYKWFARENGGSKNYSQQQFVEDLRGALRSDAHLAEDMPFRLEPAVIENAKTKKSVFVPTDPARPQGEGMYFQALTARAAPEAELTGKRSYEAAAVKAGLDPAQLHATAKMIRGADVEGTREHNAVLAETRRMLEEHGQTKNFSHFRDADEVPGLDEAADYWSKRIPHYADADTLFAMLKEGNRKPLSEKEAYEQAHETLRAQKEANDARQKAIQSGHGPESIEEAVRSGQEDAQAEAGPGRPGAEGDESARAESGDTGFDFGANAPAEPGTPATLGGKLRSAVGRFMKDPSGALDLNRIKELIDKWGFGHTPKNVELSKKVFYEKLAEAKEVDGKGLVLPVIPLEPGRRVSDFTEPGWYQQDGVNDWALQIDEGGNGLLAEVWSGKEKSTGLLYGTESRPDRYFHGKDAADMVKQIDDLVREKMTQPSSDDIGADLGRPGELTGEDYSLMSSAEKVARAELDRPGSIRNFLEGEAGAWDLQKTWDWLKAAARSIKQSATGEKPGLVDSLKKTFAPAARGPEAAAGAGVMRENLADMRRSREIAREGLKAGEKHFDKTLVNAPDPPGTPPGTARNKLFADFFDAIEKGKIDTLPEPLKEIAQFMRDGTDAREKEAVDRGIINRTIENYMGHLWKKPGSTMTPEEIGRMLGARRPLAGREGFKHQRNLDLYSDGLGLGLEPIDWNPARLVLKAWEQVDKSIAAYDIRAELIDQGRRILVRLGKDAPDGWTRSVDPGDTKYGKRDVPITTANPRGEVGPVLEGHFYQPEPITRLLDNHLQPGLRGDAIYDAVRNFGNLQVQFQHGLSGFHAGFVALDTIISGGALGLQQISRGDVGKGLFSIGKGLTPPVAGMALGTAVGGPVGGAVGLAGGVAFNAWRNWIKGSRVLSEYFKPGSQGAETAEIMKGLMQGGYSGTQDAIYKNDYVTKFRESLSSVLAGKGGYGGVLFRALPALVEAISHPLLGMYVPRMKAAVGSDMIAYELSKMGPKDGINERRAIMGKAWDSVENRLGQLTYDNLFWSRTMKDVLMAGVRSVGWNLGTWRELGGGIKDIPSSIGGIFSGKGISPRTAYTIMLPMVAGVFGAMYQYMATGKGPDELKDYFFPKTGKTRPDGSADRMSLPSYMRDVGHLTNRADEGPYRVLQNVWKMTKGKANPVLTLVGDMLSNEDYYGAAIVNPNDKATKQALDLAGHLAGSFEPLSSRTYRQRQDRGVGGFLQSQLGIVPAPSYITHTAQEQRDAEAGKKFISTPLEKKRQQDVKSMSPEDQRVEKLKQAMERHRYQQTHKK